jgi:hypothetical protein
MSASEKVKKKLEKFVKADKTPSSKRYKTLLSISNALEGNQNEERGFFHEHAELIFTLLCDKWTELASVEPKKKGIDTRTPAHEQMSFVRYY